MSFLLATGDVVDDTIDTKVDNDGMADNDIVVDTCEVIVTAIASDGLDITDD